MDTATEPIKTVPISVDPNFQPGVRREREMVSSYSSEIQPPANELREFGVEVINQEPNLTAEHTQVGIEPASVIKQVPADTSLQVLTKEEKQEAKGMSPSESFKWLIKLKEKVLGKPKPQLAEGGTA